jgi:hypothetical protein
MNVDDTEGILGSQSRGGSHGITSMSCDHLLIRFQATGEASAGRCLETTSLKVQTTHAPPELSEPAITKTRPLAILCFECLG